MKGLSMIKIAPSVLAADFQCIAQELASIPNADYIHFDVMDGQYVPETSYWVEELEKMRAVTDKVIDVHLMVMSPGQYIEQFAKAGADIISVHVEADSREEIRQALMKIRSLGLKAGIVLDAYTQASEAGPFLDLVDLVLVMTVKSGSGGQKFQPLRLDVVEEVRAMAQKAGIQCEIEVDGGINPDTAKLCRNAGANVLVAGTAIFAAEDRQAAIERIRG